jgi:hypothetical protein
MGGEIKWEALDIMVAKLGVDDVSLFITHLVTIRDHCERQANG